MSLNYTPQTVTADEYQRIFELERAVDYPVIDAIEARLGFAIERERLEELARVLSCPFKAAAPHWQHGRVLYAAARHYLRQLIRYDMRCLDIGTAKGFSAMCVRLAVEDGGMDGAAAFSVDVMPPLARVRRNTPAEVDGLKTLPEILEPFPSAKNITFLESTGIDWLQGNPQRIHFAFVDGKHSGTVVRKEGVLLASRQEPGDVVMFDDVHIPEVSVAVTSLHHYYRIEYINVLPKRAYALAVRR